MDKDIEWYKELVKTADYVVSDKMELKTRALPDDTLVHTEIFCGYEYIETCTLGQWRKLWNMLDSLYKELRNVTDGLHT